jgi:gamma-glutamyltranspeptidase / glutathione hydrolase
MCAPFLAYKVCVMGPTSFGGVVVLQKLQMLEARLKGAAPAGQFNFDDPEFVHLYAEAARLAQADRLHYIGDPAFTKVPAAALIAAPYVKERAALLDAHKRAPTVSPGVIDAKTALLDTAPGSETMDATSQMAIVDAEGNALSITTTNLNFGSRILVDTAAAALAPALSARGHTVEIVPLPSGQGFLMRKDDGWIGAADPRRDGVAMGY